MSRTAILLNLIQLPFEDFETGAPFSLWMAFLMMVSASRARVSARICRRVCVDARVINQN